ncbi:Bug family tripartite tricarboxylate transporter substrate binding protein [Falsiroseomonas tokyonensis]|uniref:Bug family tripartite tricarboxylate transporter substrate binding protein n=1 Tax=Falsiroseomonas tokyonensis TaxID=430521 RepID=A0ABV7BU26_9PROT|nr:tripartite tricarboxylate transporter substrate binding protein [Falsiroseomonas tokyonensis]MBU8539007.1 tripartite tricarboxylate transporter substrate binding protein [Falsiroseomonas tokyonensis]
MTVAPTRRGALALALGGLALPAPGRAQGLRNARLVVPYPPGGTTDLTARLIAPRAAELLGGAWVIENRSGANGVVGAELVARSAPDGGTLLYSNEVLTVLPFVQRNVPFDLRADFTPVARTVSIPYVLVGGSGLAPQDLTALLAALRATPERFSFAGSSLGSVGQLATAALWQKLGVETTFVSYRGTGPAMNDLVSGAVSLFFAPLGPAIPLVREGRLRAYCVTSAGRQRVLPEVPTLIEAGFPDMAYEGWTGIWGPKDLPADFVTRANAAVNQAAAEPAVAARMADLGLTPLAETPARFAEVIAAEIARNQALVAAARIQPQ